MTSEKNESQPFGAKTSSARPIAFSLVGRRSYVRATDVLRELRKTYPDSAISLKFIKPLTGFAKLSTTKSRHACVVANVDGTPIFLSNDLYSDAKPKQLEEKDFLPLSLNASWRNTYVFLFFSKRSLEDKLEKCIAILHPRLQDSYVVRRVSLKRGRKTFIPLLWFRLVHHESRRTAKIKINAYKRCICEVYFLRK